MKDVWVLSEKFDKLDDYKKSDKDLDEPAKPKAEGNDGWKANLLECLESIAEMKKIDKGESVATIVQA